MDLRWSASLLFVVCVAMRCERCMVEGGFQDCFRQDSISCLQTQLFEMAKDYSGKATIEIVSGFTLIKQYGNEGKSLEEIEAEEGVESAKDVPSRQKALETYLISIGKNLWKERTVAWNPVLTAKVLLNTIPETVTSQLTSFVSEARGKKKQLQMLVPLLIALKLKFFTLSSIAGMIIALLAKKAILAAAVSLVLSGVTGLKSLIGGNTKSTAHATEVMGYHASGEWEPTMFAAGGGYSNYGRGNSLGGSSSNNEPAPHHQVFIGHKAS